MALIVEDRVAETSTTTGTGALTLAGALISFRTFASVMAVSDTCYYIIEAVDADGAQTGDWETGLGTYSGVNTLTRTTVQRSSNANAAVNFAAGTKWVSLSPTRSYLGTLSSGTANTYLMPDGGTSSADSGGFATLSNAFIPLNNITISHLRGVWSNDTIGNVYSMFIATTNSSGVISGTTVSATSTFTTTTTGWQDKEFAITSTTLTAGTIYIVALVRTNGTGTSVCGAMSITSTGYTGMPHDFAAEINQLGSVTKRFWYTQNSASPSSGSPSSSSTGGNYMLGMRAQL